MWYNNSERLAVLAGLMRDAGCSIDEVIRMLERPWRWNDQWAYHEATGENPLIFETDDELQTALRSLRGE